MSETPAPEAKPAEPAAPAAPETPAQEPAIDWKAEARKWEARAKENKTALDELTGKYAEVESEKGKLATKVQAYKAKEARAELVAEVSKETGVPAELLRGDTKEDLEAHAEVLKPLIKPSGPIIPGQERQPLDIEVDPVRQFAKSLFENAKNE